MRPQIITLTGSGSGVTNSLPIRMNWRVSNVSLSLGTDGTTTGFTAQYTMTPPDDYASSSAWGAGAVWHDFGAIDGVTQDAASVVPGPVQGIRLQADANGTDSGTLIATQADEAAETPTYFSTRAALVGASSYLTPLLGTVWVSEGVFYEYDGVSSGISDLPGWKVLGDITFDDVAAVLADTNDWYPEGQILRTKKEGFVYEVVSSDASIQTDGGVNLRRVPITPNPTPRGRGKIALIFDDGYKNNVTVALPVRSIAQTSGHLG